METECECPHCHYKKRVKINYLCKVGFTCPKCNDNISYPNKFGRELLSQLPVENVIYEYSPKWANKKSYDNYFEYKGNKYILEMDGKQHSDNITHIWKTSKEEQLQNDTIKTQLANEHNINLIRIDCYYSNLNYIKKSILNSELSQIFNLNNIDWDACDRFCKESFVIKIAKYWEEHPTYTNNMIADHFQVCRETARRTLNKARKLGLCNYVNNKHNPTIATEEDGTEIEFNSIEECKLYYKNKGYVIRSNDITNCNKGKRESFKGLRFRLKYPPEVQELVNSDK